MKNALNSNNFQHNEKSLSTSVNNLQITLKFKIHQIKIVSVLLLDELKNTVLRKSSKVQKLRKSLKVGSLPTCSLRHSTRKAVTLKMEYFQGLDLLHFIFGYLKYILRKKNGFLQNST